MRQKDSFHNSSFKVPSGSEPVNTTALFTTRRIKILRLRTFSRHLQTFLRKTPQQPVTELDKPLPSGSGTVAIQRVGVDPDTAAPVLKSTIVTGDYASAPEGTYALQYRRRIAPGIFNSSAVLHEVTINYIGTADRLADAVGLVRADLDTEQPETAGEIVSEPPGD